MIRLSVKAGIVGGSVVYLTKAGAWGNSQESQAMYNEVKNVICPYIIPKQLLDTPTIPKSDNVRFLVKYYYNKSVNTVINFVCDFPSYTSQLVKKLENVSNTNQISD